MRCADVERRLNELLDARRNLASDRELQRHLEDCPACRDLSIAYGMVVSAAQELRAEAIDDCVTAAGGNGTSPWWTVRGAWSGSAAALAAGLLVAACGLWIGSRDRLDGGGRIALRQERDRPPQPAVETRNAEPVIVQSQSEPETTRDLVSAVAQGPDAAHAGELAAPSGNLENSSAGVNLLAEAARQQYLELARHTSQSFAHASLLMPSASELRTDLDGLGSPQTALADGDRLVAGVATGLRPVTSSTALAVQSLWRTLADPVGGQ